MDDNPALVRGETYIATKEFRDKDGVVIKEGQILYNAMESSSWWRFHDEKQTRITCLTNEWTARANLKIYVNP